MGDVPVLDLQTLLEMRHDAEQFDLFERDDLFRSAPLLPGTIVRLIWREPGRKPRPGPHRYRVLSPALAFLLKNRDPGTMHEWELRLVNEGVALLALDGPRPHADMMPRDFLPECMLFWRKRDAVTAGY